MHAVPLAILEKWVENGSFNPECMAEGDYSRSMAILIILSPNAQCTALESASIRLIVHWCKAPIGQIGTIPHLIKYAHSLMELEGQSTEPKHRTFCVIMGNYGRHMAFATDLPFCTAYSLEFIVKEDPAQMTFRNQQNHPVSFTRDGLLVHQLLMWDFPECEYVDGYSQWVSSHSQRHAVPQRSPSINSHPT